MTTTHATDPQLTAMTDRIRTAYHQALTLGIHHAGWVDLTELRALAGGPRELQDAALRALALNHQANLVPRADQRNLTRADHTTALWYGNEANHRIHLNR